MARDLLENAVDKLESSDDGFNVIESLVIVGEGIVEPLARPLLGMRRQHLVPALDAILIHYDVAVGHWLAVVLIEQQITYLHISSVVSATIVRGVPGRTSLPTMASVLVVDIERANKLYILFVAAGADARHVLVEDDTAVYLSIATEVAIDTINGTTMHAYDVIVATESICTETTT